MPLSRLSRFTIALVSLLALGACSSITVSTDHAEIDFSTLKTYAWLHEGVAEDNGKSNDIIDGHVKAAVDGKLESKGMQQVDKASAAVYVNYYVTSEQKTDIKTYNSYSGYYPGYSWRGGYGPGHNYVFYDPMYTAPIQEQVVTEYLKGTMIIDMVDPKTNKLIWRGTGGKRLDDMATAEERQDNINNVVAKLLAEYPPKKK